MCFFVADETMPLGGEPAVGNDASCCEECWVGGNLATDSRSTFSPFFVLFLTPDK
jgi:hypothetical protein